jgi:hypothetical protein
VVALLIEPLEYSNVFFEAMILIAGDVSRGRAFDLAYGMRKAIPISFALAVNIPCAFPLVCSGGHALEKPSGKRAQPDAWSGSILIHVFRAVSALEILCPHANIRWRAPSCRPGGVNSLSGVLRLENGRIKRRRCSAGIATAV